MSVELVIAQRVEGPPARTDVPRSVTLADPTQCRRDVVAILAVAVVAVLLRAGPVLGSDFPLNDGGLFYVMARDIQRLGFGWPAFTSYNGGTIPFAYPPLGPMLAALLANLLPVPLLQWFLWLPLLFSCLTVAGVYLVARQLLDSRFDALAAAAAFAVVPEGYQWLIEGGGVTRAPGFLFALFAVVFVLRWRKGGGILNAGMASVMAGVALLFHPSAGLFAAVSIAILLFRRPFGRSLATILLVGGGMALVAAPWWVVALIRVGPAGLTSAGGLSGPAGGLLTGGFDLVTFTLTGEVAMPWVGALGVLGLVRALSRREWLLPAWLVVEVLVDQRLGLMFAAVPVSLLAATGLSAVVVPAVAGLVPPFGSGHLPGRLWQVRSARWLLIFAVEGAVLSGLLFNASAGSPEHGLPPADRAAMSWVAANTPSSAQFAVVTSDPSGSEGTQEWFPALTGRESDSVPQGSEWLGPGVWSARYAENIDLQACAGQTAGCLRAWLTLHGVSGTYVFLPKGHLRGPGSAADCCMSLRESLQNTSDFDLVYDGPGASIYRWAPARADARRARPRATSRA